MASPYDGALWVADGSAPLADNPLKLKPGDSVILSYHVTNIIEGFEDATYTYGTPSVTAYNGGDPGDLIITPDPLGTFVPNTLTTNLEPDGSTGYTDVGAFTIKLNASAPIGASYDLEIGALGIDSDTVNIDSGDASRAISSVPEFPTVALPVAAILGLVFIFGRKKEGL